MAPLLLLLTTTTINIIFTIVIIIISIIFTIYIFTRPHHQEDKNYTSNNNNNNKYNFNNDNEEESDDDALPAYIIDDDDDDDDTNNIKTTILITGGTGVLGWRVAAMCKERFPSDSTEITIFDINVPKPHRKLKHVTYIQGDITSEIDTICAFATTFTHPKPCKNIVFHVAGLLPAVSTTSEKLHQVNTIGSKQIVELCKNYCIDLLLATSSASVVLPNDNLYVDGLNGQVLPYPSDDNYVDTYARSKAKGEQYVLNANGANHQTSDDDVLNTKLATVSLRPSIIYGADDSKFGERLLRNEINYIFDKGNNIIDFGWADNIALGHVQCCEHILNYSTNNKYYNNHAAGKAFHLGQGIGLTTFEFYNLKEWKNGKPSSIPISLMKLIAKFNYYCYQFIGIAPIDPFLRPDSFNFMAGRHWWFKCENAKNVFGYNPISVEDSILIMQNKQMKEWNIRGKVSQEELHLYVSTNI